MFRNRKVTESSIIMPVNLTGSLSNTFVMSRITVDTELDKDSENPIANKAVYKAIQQCKESQGGLLEDGKLPHTITIGNIVYDGSKDVVIEVYNDEKTIL